MLKFEFLVISEARQDDHNCWVPIGDGIDLCGDRDPFPPDTFTMMMMMIIRAISECLPVSF